MDPVSTREEELFAAALARPAGERAAFIDGACRGDAELRAKLERLLAAHESPDSLLCTAPPRELLIEEKPGDTIGPPAIGSAKVGRYKLLQKIGEGGCGVVWMAEQEEPVRRRVALKVIKLGMDTKAAVARFEAERQALAMMDHPNIAKVYDAGVVGGMGLPTHESDPRVGRPVPRLAGRPYFVMELIRGIPITRYCDENHLTPAARLELFIKVCQAIQHAHQKGIIHRDIKPSNILVTVNDGQPTPKVIDFGIAKAMQGKLTDATLFTAFEQFIGTPVYMSPEQAEMSSLDIDTRSDIYSLGVLLYELLTGRTPFDRKELLDAGLDEIRRRIREVEPPKPSTRLSTMEGEALTVTAHDRDTEPPKLINLVRGDLDWIVMRCLEKDRVRRYDTANGLALDIQRHLRHEPVWARPPSASYRLRKLVRRHRLTFFACAAVTAALVFGLALSTWMFVREKAARSAAERERAVAETERNRAYLAEQEQVALRQNAEIARSAEAHQRVSAEQARERAVAAEQKATAEAAISKAVSDFLTNDLLRQADSWAQADAKVAPNPDLMVREALDRAGATVGDRFRSQPLVEAAIRAAIGSTYRGVGEFGKSALHHERALEIRRRILGPTHHDTLASINSLALAYQAGGKLPQALPLLEETLRAQQAKLGPDDPHTLLAMNNLASAYRSAGKRDQALPLFEENMERTKARFGAEHRNTLTAMINLASAYQSTGKLDQALPLFEETLRLRQATLGKEHPSTLLAMDSLAAAYQAAKQLPKALPLFEETLARRKTGLGPDHPETLHSMLHLAVVYRTVGKLQQALPLYEDTFTRRRTKLGPDHPETLSSLLHLASAFRAAGRLAQVLPLSEEALTLRRAKLGPEHPDTLQAMNTLAHDYYVCRKLEQAIPLYESTIALLKSKFGPADRRTLASMTHLYWAYEQMRAYDRAEAIGRELMTQRLQREAADSVRLAADRAQFGKILLDTGKFAEAETVLRAALAVREKKLPGSWWMFHTRHLLGGALAGQKRYRDAEPLLVSGCEEMLRLKDKMPRNVSQLQQALERTIAFFTATGRPDVAAQWRNKLEEYEATRPRALSSDDGCPPER